MCLLQAITFLYTLWCRNDVRILSELSEDQTLPIRD